MQIHRITASQNVRGWKGPLWVTEAGSPTVGCTGPCPGRSWISPKKKTPQPPWAACSSAPSPSEGRSSSSCSDGASSASVCAHCPLSCRWAPLKRVWPHPPDTHPWGIYKHLLGPLTAFSLDPERFSILADFSGHYMSLQYCNTLFAECSHGLRKAILTQMWLEVNKGRWEE